MFLKNLELFGFKSFPDRTRLEFADGITSLLGPNGCGKSNIVDSIKWVLGEQSSRTLRAGKMEDVIFNGTETRKPLNVAEVSLVISNEAGFLPLDIPEIEIKRRLYRSGENEYFINKMPARLKEVRELFFDTGIGKSAYSILEQGKIDQILSHRPEDRRYIFEEAAGITRFKQRSIEAGKKLEKTEENLKQVESIMREVKTTYDTRKVQAERVVVYRTLKERIFELEVLIQLLRVKGLHERKAQKDTLLQALETEYGLMEEEVAKINEELSESLEIVNRLSRNRIDIQTRLQRLEEVKISHYNQKEVLHVRERDFERAIDEAKKKGEGYKTRIFEYQEEIEEKQLRAASFAAEIEKTERDINSFQERIKTAEHKTVENQKNIKRIEQLIREKEEQQLQFRKDMQVLTDTIVVELDARIQETGYSYKHRKELETELQNGLKTLKIRFEGIAERVQDIVSIYHDSPEELLKLYEEQHAFYKKASQGIDKVLEQFTAYLEASPSFLDDFLAPEGVITRKHQLDRKIDAAFKDIEDMRDTIEELREENRELSSKMLQYRDTLEQLRMTKVDMASQATALSSIIKNLQRSVHEMEMACDDSFRDAEQAAERLQETRDKILQLEEEKDQAVSEERRLKIELEDTIYQIEQEDNSVSDRRATMTKAYSRMSEVSKRKERLEVEMESTDQELKTVYENFLEVYSCDLDQFSYRMDEVGVLEEQKLREELRAKRSEIQSLGYINHMAEEEYKEVEERYEFLKRQIDDLDKARKDLLRITTEITERSIELFSVSYEQIKQNFQLMFRKLFGGGRAELKLVDPEDILNTGIDILAQPPGKKLEKISLLSGGERSLTAVSLLLATYLVKPSPFCILDEIDAALDDANIGYFLNVLVDFSKTSQFIIITHNKKTVLGSSTLLGVTMQEPGVSRAIAYRIGDDPDKQTIY